MANAANVREDMSLTSRLDRNLHRLEMGIALIAGGIILLMLGFSFLNILSRGLFNDPLNVYFDVARQSVILIAFLGLSYCQRNGGHIRMEMVISAVQGRARWFAELLGSLAILAVVLFISLGMMFDALVDFREGVSTEDSRILKWPSKAIAVLMLWLMALRLAFQSWLFARATITNEEPIGVPLLETPEEQAAAEARSVQASQT